MVSISSGGCCTNGRFDSSSILLAVLQLSATFLPQRINYHTATKDGQTHLRFVSTSATMSIVTDSLKSDSTNDTMGSGEILCTITIPDKTNSNHS